MRRPTIFVTLACLGLLSLIGAAPVAATAGWAGPARVLADYYPLSPSAVLRSGVLHVAYFHQQGIGGDQPNGIFYASNASGTWQKQRITTGDDFYARPSLAVDDQGFVSIAFARVCFCVPFSSSIWMATNRNGAWQVSQRTRDQQDVAPSLKYAGGALHLAFQRVDVGIIYQSKATGAWVSTTVDSAVGACHIDQFPSLGIDANGKAWIAFERPRFGGCNTGGSSYEGIRVATNAGGAWAAQTLTTNREDYQPELALDGTGRPHVILHRATDASIYYARRTGGGTWTMPLRVAAGNDATLAIDAVGKAHVAFEGSGPTYATNRSGSFVTTPLAAYSLDFGTNSPVRILLTNAGKARVLYARAEGGSEDDFGLFLAKER